jgi:hypothetical protein
MGMNTKNKFAYNYLKFYTMKKLLFIIMMTFLSTTTFAQVAINASGDSPNSSAMLDVSSNSKGFLAPSMTTNQRTAISSPANGLMVYDTDTNSFWFYNTSDGEWQNVGDGAVGATNINDLSDGKTGGQSVFLGSGSGNVDDGSENYNVGVGHSTLYNCTSGFWNIAIGGFALFNSSTGEKNIAIGKNALGVSDTGSMNIAIGNYALEANKVNGNIAIGNSALSHSEEGTGNIAIGNFADWYNQTGSHNTIIGYTAGTGTNYHSKSGCVFLGYAAGCYETDSNKLYIENSSSNTPLIGGDFDADEVYINGTIKITGGSPGTDKVLTSDADGNASWETPASPTMGIDDLTDAKNGASNLFMGTNAGQDGYYSSYNLGIGHDALRHNSAGDHNTAVGYKSLDVNYGDWNTAFGLNSLGANTAGNGNVALGNSSLTTNTHGDYNTAVGYNSYVTTTTWYSNSTAVGYNTPIDGSNQVHLGNTSITEIKGQVGFTVYSDGRIKENIKEDVVGLEFIRGLRPVTYNINLDKENQLLGITDTADFDGKYDITKIRMTGFIAQEVENVMKECSYDFSGLNKPDGSNDLYGLSYSQFVVPLVKAVQQLDAENQKLSEQMQGQKQQLEEQRKTIEMLIKKMETLESSR